MPKGPNTADAAQNKQSGVPEACGSWVQTSSPDAKGALLVGAGDGVRIGDGRKPCYQAGDGAYVSFFFFFYQPSFFLGGFFLPFFSFFFGFCG